jgi:hypothetical protein
MSENQTTANPEVVEETSSTVDATNPSQEDVNDAIFGSDGGFFDALDRDVNGAIIDDEDNEVQETIDTLPDMATQQEDNNSSADPDGEDINWEKRYKDSSREAQKMKAKLDEVETFRPFIESLKSDEGMVQTIKEYLEHGRKPMDMKEQLNLPEDFVFDMDEAVQDPKSNSAKVFGNMIDNIVDSRVQNELKSDRDSRNKEASQAEQQRLASKFRSENNISEDEFDGMMEWANDHKISFEDIHFLKNKDKYMSNVAKNTKTDMLNQMKAVRSIPTSAGATNSSAKAESDPNKLVFDALKNIDGGVDNLFG